MSDRISQMIEIQKEGLELFSKKNKDYGDAFAEFGVIGVFVRMEDKLKRFVSVSNSKVEMVQDEKLYDTLLDLHNYSAMALMLLKNKN